MLTATSEVDSSSYVRIGRLIGHPKHVDCVAWSQDGKRLATGSYDNTVRIWDAATRKCDHVYEGHGMGISDVAWSPDTEVYALATGSHDHSLRLWRADDGEFWNFGGHTEVIRCIAWIGTGMVASGASDGWTRLWKMGKSEPYRKISSNECWINAIAYCDGVERLAIGLADGTIQFENPFKPPGRKNNPNFGDFKAHHDYVNALAWMPGTNLLCSGSGHGTVRIWDIGSKKHVAKMDGEDGHLDKILRVSFSHDGRYLASIGQDRLVLWDTKTWKSVHEMKGPFPTKTYLPLAFSPTGPILAASIASDLTAVELIEFP